MAKINTVLFDFDGTLMDTNEIIIGSWQHTFKTVEGRERPLEEIVRTFGEPLKATMEKVLPEMDADEAVEIYRSFHKDVFDEKISLFPGIKDLLTTLKSRGYKLGVVTSRLTGTTMRGLEKYEIRDCFDAIVTCDDTDKHKPDPEPIFIALEKLGASPRESIMLGDTMFDILCAKNAGVRSVLVGWALAVSEEERRGENAPDHIIETAESLLELLEEK